ncbi:flagellin [Nocardioides sp. L-11A]|uniref:flagellin N-terminal helical domain-containing protein n=1 Tax=Nocardioides sp. L-11A TaxID=3043848 RepID=UPI00249A204A|nr:flagellin [Nocardioides sp. L-11A]
MGLRINQNIEATNAYRNLSVTQGQLSKSMEKLSSGFRINRAADDAAGLAISEGLRSQVGGLKVAVRNAQDGISVVQTTEGALTEVHSILQRMRDLAVQASSDSNNAKARANIAAEATQLTQELDRIGQSTNFNGTKLLDGSAGTLNFQVGANGDGASNIAVNLTSANVAGIASSLTVGSAGAQIAVATPTAVTGAQAFTITNPGGGTSTVNVTLGAAGSYNTVEDVANALNADSGFAQSLTATVDNNNNLVVSALNGGTVVGGATAGTHAAAGTGLGVSVAGPAGALDFSSHAGAQAAITLINAKIEDVSTARANLGALQNRFEHTIANVNVAIENLSASESRIRDTDMASEMMSFTRAQILSQAGTAMLAQANSAPNGVLQLLRG